MRQFQSIWSEILRKPLRLAPLVIMAVALAAAPAFAQTNSPTPKPKPKAQASKKSAPTAARISTAPEPTYDEGTALRIAAAMLSYSTLEVRGGWPTMPAEVANLAPGASGPEVAMLRERLAIADDLAPEHASGDVFDDKLTAALKRFQARHGLEETGTVGRRTLAALNVPVSKRLRQLAASLDRLAGMDFVFGQQLRGGEHSGGGRRGGRERPGRAPPRHHRRQARPALADAHHAPHRGQSQSDLDGAAVDPEERHPSPRCGAIPATSHACVCACSTAQAARSIRARSNWHSDGAPNFTVRQDSGSHNALGSRALRHAESAFGLPARHQQPLAVQRRLPLPVVGLRAP